MFHLYDTADNVTLEAVKVDLEAIKQHRLLLLAKENSASPEAILKKNNRRSLSGAGRRSQLEQTDGRVAKARASLVAQETNLQDALTGADQVLGRYLEPRKLAELIS